MPDSKLESLSEMVERWAEPVERMKGLGSESQWKLGEFEVYRSLEMCAADLTHWLEGARALVAEFVKFADTDHSKGMKLSDSRKQAQYELMMAGHALAYATAAAKLSARLGPVDAPSAVAGEERE